MEIMGNVDNESQNIDPRNNLNNLSGKEWIQLSKSFWFQKGLGKGHKETEFELQHPAPFSYQNIMELIRMFTKPGMTVLDPFCGIASTLKAAGLTRRNGIGIEISSKWVKLGKERLEAEIPEQISNEVKLKIIKGDSLQRLKKMTENSIDFIVTSPPYWGILNKDPDHKIIAERVNKDLATKYSSSPNDLGNIESYEVFLSKLSGIISECYRVLKSGSFISIIVGDFYHKSKFYPFHMDIQKNISDIGFELRGITILAQNNKKLFPYGYPYTIIQNIHHQYIMIFRKPKS